MDAHSQHAVLTRRPVWRLVVCALGLTLTLAACSRDTSEQEAAAPAAETAAAPSTIVEIAAEDERLSILTTALDTAGLVETLQGAGSFTVFAPTDDAFDALPDGTVQDLLLLENRDRLTTILTHHVAEGTAMAADVQNLSSVTTLAGSDLPISISNGAVHVGNATVVEADVQSSNGVIHIIDAVLLPPDDENM